MASPLTVRRNNYVENPKPSAIYTPPGVAIFLFNVLWRPEFRAVLDPAIGSGRLTDPWRRAGCRIIGCDIARARAKCDVFRHGRFEEQEFERPDLVLCNPPFNGATGKRLYPEVFLARIFELFGPSTPTAMFVPMGFRLNQRRKSARWRWCRDCGAQITSIVSLPLDTFEGVEFHAEVLIWNVTQIRPHYYLTEESL